MKARWILLALPLVLLAAAPRVDPAQATLERELAAAKSAVAAHRRADELAATDPRAAAARLADALALDFPAGAAARELRADLHARRAQLLLQAGETRSALEAARAGLAEERSAKPDAFTALLRLREGAALEALGDDDGAVSAYREVIEIGKALLAQRKEQSR